MATAQGIEQARQMVSGFNLSRWTVDRLLERYPSYFPRL
jgi:hypothetical protein